MVGMNHAWFSKVGGVREAQDTDKKRAAIKSGLVFDLDLRSSSLRMQECIRPISIF